MTDWLAGGDAPGAFTIDRDCELKSPVEEKSAVRYVRHTLEGDDVRQHIAGGKLPTRLALTWSDRVSLILTDKLEIKRVAFLDIVKEEAESQAENAAEQFEADFALMSGEFSRLLPAVVDALVIGQDVVIHCHGTRPDRRPARSPAAADPSAA